MVGVCFFYSLRSRLKFGKFSELYSSAGLEQILNRPESYGISFYEFCTTFNSLSRFPIL